MHNVSAAILLGGYSTRMGRDKALLKLPDGRTLLDTQIQRLQHLGIASVLLSGREEQRATHTRPQAAWISDAWPDCGPLGGIATVLAHSPTPFTLVMAVDLPHVSLEFLAYLSQHPATVFSINDRYEPLLAVYPAEVLPLAKVHLLAKDYRLQNWVKQGIAAKLLNTKPLPTAWHACLTNCNSPEDWNLGTCES